MNQGPAVGGNGFVIAQTRKYNAAFTEDDVRSLCVFARDAAGAVIGGLTGKTYW
jgi:hypothetical protein